MEYTKPIDEISKYSIGNSEIEIINPDLLDSVTYADVFDLLADKFKIEVFIEYNFYCDLYYSRIVVKKGDSMDDWESKYSDRYSTSAPVFRDAILMAVGEINKPQ